MTTSAQPLPDRAWLAALNDRLDQPALRAREPLALACAGRDAVLIGSIEAELAARLVAAGLPLRAADGVWRIDVAAPADIDPALAGIARWLHAHQLTSKWRDELLAVTGPDGAAVGAIERAAVRVLGIATRSVHLVVATEDGKVWVQQRALDKAIDPGLWDTTVGGLAAAGESVALTLERETWEEAGLHVADLHGLTSLGHQTVRRPVSNGYMIERIDLFTATLMHAATPVNQDGEVARFACIDPAQLIKQLHANQFTWEAGMILAIWLEHLSVRAVEPLSLR